MHSTKKERKKSTYILNPRNEFYLIMSAAILQINKKYDKNGIIITMTTFTALMVHNSEDFIC